MGKNYYNERNYNNILKLQNLEKELPAFCSEFFLGIEPRTSVLTRLNYAYDLKVFLDYLSKNLLYKDVKSIDLEDLKKITQTDLEKYLAFLTFYKDENGKTHTNKEYSRARRLASIRTMFKYFFNKGKLESNTAAKVDFPKIHEKEIIRLDVNEVADILDQSETGAGLSDHQKFYHSKTKVRDNAILTLFLGTGIRISELVGLNIEDVDFNSNAFTVVRKGGNSTILYFSDEVANALRRYLDERLTYPDVPKEEKALFLSMQNRRISTKAVENLVTKYARIVSPLKKITPHKLRSTFGTELYRATGDIYVVADVLGHRDVNTTKKHYAALDVEIRKNAARKVKLRDDD
ncbi:MAG TPA: tyrosine-type recombinase/integrase [Clostridia bacterium]